MKTALVNLRASNARPSPLPWPSLFRGIPLLLHTQLPANLQGFHWTARSFQAKAWYGNPALHYEIWPRKDLKVAELGLHFEADELTNARLFAAFRARAKEIKRALGSDARIEGWDKGWARVWEQFSFDDPALAERLPERFSDYVRTLEPILREELPSDVPWALPAPQPTAVSAMRRRPRRPRTR